MKLFKRANYKGCFITTTARPADVTQHARKNKQHLREEATAYREMLTTSSTKRSTRMRKDTDQEAVNRGTKGADQAAVRGLTQGAARITTHKEVGYIRTTR